MCQAIYYAKQVMNWIEWTNLLYFNVDFAGCGTVVISFRMQVDVRVGLVNDDLVDGNRRRLRKDKHDMQISPAKKYTYIHERT